MTKSERAYNKFRSRTYHFALIWTLLVVLALTVQLAVGKNNITIPVERIVEVAGLVVSLFMGKSTVKEIQRPKMEASKE